MVKLFANSEEPDQTLPSVAYDLGLYCFPVILLGSSHKNDLIFVAHLEC